MPYIIQILAPGFSTNSESFDLAVYYGKIIFPYLIFISLAAHFTSILNVHEKFAAGAFAPAILNISFILSLIYYYSLCNFCRSCVVHWCFDWRGCTIFIFVPIGISFL